MSSPSETPPPQPEAPTAAPADALLRQLEEAKAANKALEARLQPYDQSTRDAWKAEYEQIISPTMQACAQLVPEGKDVFEGALSQAGKFHSDARPLDEVREQQRFIACFSKGHKTLEERLKAQGEKFDEQAQVLANSMKKMEQLEQENESLKKQCTEASMLVKERDNQLEGLHTGSSSGHLFSKRETREDAAPKENKAGSLADWVRMTSPIGTSRVMPSSSSHGFLGGFVN